MCETWSNAVILMLWHQRRSLQRCVLVARRCHNFVCLLGSEWCEKQLVFFIYLVIAVQRSNLNN